MSRIRTIEQAFARETLPQFGVGDTVDVHVLIREGEKERVQIFSGTVIRKRGAGMSATYTIRRIVQGQGVERIFPMHSPFVQKVDVKRRGKTRRSRLYYLRDRKGKATRLREIIGPRPIKKAKVKAAKAPKAEPAPAPVENDTAPNEATADE
ncbi:MAG: 50S ribosomal protein L19 [Planctomycetota bacterium]|jgi:large subunit ribosomal protein L19